MLQETATGTVITPFTTREIGEFLIKIVAPGATMDWRNVLKEATGDE